MCGFYTLNIHTIYTIGFYLLSFFALVEGGQFGLSFIIGFHTLQYIYAY